MQSLNESYTDFSHFKDEEEHEQAKSKVVEEIKADDNIEITNNDNDDSINLTIGEEDEQLFEENDIKPKGNLRYAGRIISGGCIN